MSRVVQDFTDLLLKTGVISLDQLTAARGGAFYLGGTCVRWISAHTAQSSAFAFSKYTQLVSNFSNLFQMEAKFSALRRGFSSLSMTVYWL